MRRRWPGWVVLLGLAGGCAPAPDEPAESPPQSLQIESEAVTAAGRLAAGWACQDRSLPLRWTGAPAEAAAFALTLAGESPPLTHWIAWNISGDADSLPAGVAPTGFPPRQGMSGAGRIGFAPLCPAPGQESAYIVRIYALSRPIALPPTASGAELGAAVRARAIAWGELRFTAAGAPP